MDDLNGKQKAAAVLLSVDSETAAAILKQLPESELAAVTKEMHKLGDVNPENLTTVLHEFSIHASMPDESLRANPGALCVPRAPTLRILIANRSKSAGLAGLAKCRM